MKVKVPGLTQDHGQLQYELAPELEGAEEITLEKTAELAQNLKEKNVQCIQYGSGL